MHDSFARWLSVLSLIVGLFSLAFTFIWNEMGPIAAKPDPKFDVADKLGLLHDFEGPVMFPTIEILNRGKETAKIGRMLIYLSANSPNSAVRNSRSGQVLPFA